MNTKLKSNVNKRLNKQIDSNKLKINQEKKDYKNRVKFGFDEFLISKSEAEVM